MADDGSKQSATIWPIPKFHFQVNWDSQVMLFQEVNGLDISFEEINYRHGGNLPFSAFETPRLKKMSNVTMKKGILKSDNKFWSLFNQIKMNTIQRMPVNISLVDEAGNATMVWTLTNAWPTKITATDLKSEGNEVAIETIEFAHEGLVVTKS